MLMADPKPLHYDFADRAWWGSCFALKYMIATAKTCAGWQS